MIDPLVNLPARNQASAIFIENANQIWPQLNAYATQANALAAGMGNIAAGTAFSVPYMFDTATTDSDPTAGKLRLGSATQNTATVIRADLLGADGADWTSVLNSFAASSSAVTGQIRLVKLSDATKFLVFNVSAVASPSGYRNITVSNVASSSASPFSNGDQIALLFTRTGDKGESIAPYLYMREQQSPSTHAGASVAATISQTRVLNTVVANGISGVSLVSNVITGLTTGLYETRIQVPAWNTRSHKAFLYNVTDATYELIGSSEYAGSNTGSSSTVSGQFSVSGTKDFSIRHYTLDAVASAGLGWGTNCGQIEVYTEVEIWKVS